MPNAKPLKVQSAFTNSAFDEYVSFGNQGRYKEAFSVPQYRVSGIDQILNHYEMVNFLAHHAINSLEDPVLIKRASFVLMAIQNEDELYIRPVGQPWRKVHFSEMKVTGGGHVSVNARKSDFASMLARGHGDRWLRLDKFEIWGEIDRPKQALRSWWSFLARSASALFRK
jgi:hypothetical protein